MTKKALLTLLILAFSIVCNQAFAQDPFAIKVLNLAQLKSKFGAPVNTYEDVDDITEIRPYVAGVQPTLSPGKLNSVYNKIIPAKTGKELLELIGDDGIVYKDKTFLGFLAEHFYLDSGSFDKEGNWHEKTVTVFPYTYKPGNKPHKKKYFLCLSGGWEYIPPSKDLLPDKISCDVNKDLCDYPPCKEGKKEDVNGDGDYDDPEDINEDDEHKQKTNNVYSKLGSDLHSRRIVSTGADKNTSGSKFEMNFADRTPPRIEGCVGGEFPDIGVMKPATTGDWYIMEDLKIVDNFTEYIGTCVVLGKIDESPPGEWAKGEDWKIGDPMVIKSSEKTDYLMLPNTCHGVMRYSVFAWDEGGLVNPGEPGIIENSPETCYGLRNSPVPDLGRDPAIAQGWPIVASITGSLDSIDMTTIDPGERRGEGNVHIRDNDPPNIVICIKSLKDKNNKIYFPPVTPPGPLMPIFNSTEFNKSAADPMGNANSYRDFVGVTPNEQFNSSKIADPNLNIPLYFKIIDVQPRPTLSAQDLGMTDADKARLLDMKDPTKVEFIRNHLRLENYEESDTKKDGSREDDPSTFGARNSYGGEISALLAMPGSGGLQEDVEYEITVWADDNVKWATMEAGKVLDNIIAIPTGVVSGEVVVEVPNQHPRASYKMLFDREKAVTKPLTVVFREPTPPLHGQLSLNAMHQLKFPFIEVKATDYAGLTRKIRLYVSVSNEKPEIRVLERSHEKND